MSSGPALCIWFIAVAGIIVDGNHVAGPVSYHHILLPCHIIKNCLTFSIVFSVGFDCVIAIALSDVKHKKVPITAWINLAPCLLSVADISASGEYCTFAP